MVESLGKWLSHFDKDLNNHKTLICAFSTSVNFLVGHSGTADQVFV